MFETLKHSSSHINRTVSSEKACEGFAMTKLILQKSGVVLTNLLFSKRYIFSSFKDFNTSARA